MNCIWQDLSDAGYKGYVNPLNVSIKHNSVVMSSRLVLNNTPLWSKQRKVHYSQTDISFIWIIWHPLPVHNQTQSNDENRSVLEPPRQEREDKRQAPSSIRPGGGPMADPFTHSTTILPDHLSLFHSHFMSRKPTGSSEVKDEIKRIFIAEVSHCFTLFIPC